MSMPKTIIVQLANPARVKSLLDAAFELARPFESHVIALYIIPPVVVVGAGMPGAPATVIIDGYRKQFQANATAIHQQFETALAGSGCLGEWRVVDAEHDSVSRSLMTHIRSSDLAILGQADPQWEHSDSADFPEDAAIDSGRPILVVPHHHQVHSIGRRVVVAWNGKREAARAAFDAVPILKRAEAVKVIWANADDEPDVAGDMPAADLCEALTRHGIKCEGGATAGGSRSAGEALLAEAERFKADLLVMGCYGHSRLREFVLGGASRHILKHMHLPVLLSH